MRPVWWWLFKVCRFTGLFLWRVRDEGVALSSAVCSAAPPNENLLLAPPPVEGLKFLAPLLDGLGFDP